MIELLRSRYRKARFALALLIYALISANGLAQTHLKEFDGRYEYLHGGSIFFAGSPRDGVFYAILDEAKYPLKKISEGVFADRQGLRVVFEREATGRISGYRF